MSDSPYKPGTYVKGDSERVANSAADAVALQFDGYSLKEDAPASTAEAPVDEQPSAQPDAVKPGKAPSPSPSSDKD